MSEFGDKVKTVGVIGWQGALNRQLERDLNLYGRIREEGSQPQGTHRQHVESAMRVSDDLGRAFRADNLAETFHPEVVAELKPKPWSESPYKDFIERKKRGDA